MELKLKIRGGSAKLTVDGIIVTPLFSSKEIVISWDNIECWSVTPQVKKSGGDWHTFQNKDLTDKDIIKNQKYFEFSFAIYNRHLFKGYSLLSVLVMRLNFLMKAALDSSERIDPHKGFMHLSLKRPFKAEHLQSVFSFLDKHSVHGSIGTW